MTEQEISAGGGGYVLKVAETVQLLQDTTASQFTHSFNETTGRGCVGTIEDGRGSIAGRPMSSSC